MRIAIFGLENSGKSLLAIGLARYFSSEGKRPIYISFDVKPSALEWLVREKYGENKILELSDWGFDLLRVNPYPELSPLTTGEDKWRKAKKIVDKVDELVSGYDVVIVEVPATETFRSDVNIIATIVVLSADYIFVPYRTDTDYEIVSGLIKKFWSKYGERGREPKVFSVPVMERIGRMDLWDPAVDDIMMRVGEIGKVGGERGFYNERFAKIKPSVRSEDEAIKVYEELLALKGELERYGKEVWDNFFRSFEGAGKEDRREEAGV